MKYILLFLIGTVFFCCVKSIDKKNTKRIILTNTVKITNKIDSLKPIKKDKIISIDHWSPNDFIIKYPENYKEELVALIEYTRKRWKTVKNPIIASYSGNSVGDYFHLNFKDDHNQIYDFGFGNNNFGDYKLFDKSNDYTDNPKYLNKKFKIYWEWKVTTFPCCSGAYELVEAYLPSIIGLELITTK